MPDGGAVIFVLLPYRDVPETIAHLAPENLPPPDATTERHDHSLRLQVVHELEVGMELTAKLAVGHHESRAALHAAHRLRCTYLKAAGLQAQRSRRTHAHAPLSCAQDGRR